MLFPSCIATGAGAVFRRFPYSLIYRVVGDDVFVLAPFPWEAKPKPVAVSPVRANDGLKAAEHHAAGRGGARSLIQFSTDKIP